MYLFFLEARVPGCRQDLLHLSPGSPSVQTPGSSVEVHPALEEGDMHPKQLLFPSSLTH